MISSALRILWRIFVGCVAVGLAVVTTFSFYPYLDNHMPAFVAFALLYVFGAYVGVPFLVRLWQLVIKPTHLPIYATSSDGWSSDPVNIAIICRSKSQLIKMMKKAGWYQADPNNLVTGLRFVYAYVFGLSYPNAPFSALYLFGRKHDIGFQIQTGNPATPRHRHHVRFWQLDTEQETHAHHGFWQAALSLFARKRKQIWIGAATHDITPFAFRAQNLQVTHGIDPDTNRERDFIIETLEKRHFIKRVETITTGEPLQFRGQTFGTRIVVDGKLKVVELKKF
jgi:hypothetical protein